MRWHPASEAPSTCTASAWSLAAPKSPTATARGTWATQGRSVGLSCSNTISSAATAPPAKGTGLSSKTLPSCQAYDAHHASKNWSGFLAVCVNWFAPKMLWPRRESVSMMLKRSKLNWQTCGLSMLRLPKKYAAASHLKNAYLKSLTSSPSWTDTQSTLIKLTSQRKRHSWRVSTSWVPFTYKKATKLNPRVGKSDRNQRSENAVKFGWWIRIFMVVCRMCAHSA